MPTLLRALIAVRRRLLIHRRILIALAVATLAWSLTSAARPGSPPTQPVWVAARDLASGTVITRADLRQAAFPSDLAPRTRVADPRSLIGRTLATPLAQDEVATSASVIGRSALSGYPGRSAVPLRIPDSDAVALLHPGDHVALVGSDPQQRRSAAVIATDAIVLALPRSSPSGSGPVTSGRLVVFALPTEQATEVIGAGVSLVLTPIWNR